MKKENLIKRTTWVTTYSEIEVEEVGRARETLMKKGEAIFNVFALDFNSEFYLLGDSTEFIIAKELGISITLVEYDENDIVQMSKFEFTPEQLPELVDSQGCLRVGDLFDKYTWRGDTHKIEAELIKGEAVYTLTEQEQNMKTCTPFESGVAIHQAYLELGMKEDSDLDTYLQHCINRMLNIK